MLLVDAWVRLLTSHGPVSRSTLKYSSARAGFVARLGIRRYDGYEQRAIANLPANLSIPSVPARSSQAARGNAQQRCPAMIAGDEGWARRNIRTPIVY